MTNLQANIMLNGQKLKAFPLRSGTKTETTLIQHSTGGPSHSNQKKEEIKGIQIGKEEVKLSLFADHMIVYIENPIGSTKKLLDLISEFGKVAGYKVSIQKLMAFLYTNNELTERETKKKIPFTIL